MARRAKTTPISGATMARPEAAGPRRQEDRGRPDLGRIPVPGLRQKTRFCLNSVELVHVDNKVLERILMQKQADAIMGFGSSSLPAEWERVHERVAEFTKYIKLSSA